MVWFAHGEGQSILEATSFRHKANYCYLFCFFFSDTLFTPDFTSRCSYQKKKVFPPMLATCSWNPILREPTMELEWLMAMENINRLHWIESSTRNSNWHYTFVISFHGLTTKFGSTIIRCITCSVEKMSWHQTYYIFLQFHADNQAFRS
jgi:hypothetical protein